MQASLQMNCTFQVRTWWLPGDHFQLYLWERALWLHLCVWAGVKRWCVFTKNFKPYNVWWCLVWMYTVWCDVSTSHYIQSVLDRAAPLLCPSHLLHEPRNKHEIDEIGWIRVSSTKPILPTATESFALRMRRLLFQAWCACLCSQTGSCWRCWWQGWIAWVLLPSHQHCDRSRRLTPSLPLSPSASAVVWDCETSCMLGWWWFCVSWTHEPSNFSISPIPSCSDEAWIMKHSVLSGTEFKISEAPRLNLATVNQDWAELLQTAPEDENAWEDEPVIVSCGCTALATCNHWFSSK